MRLSYAQTFETLSAKQRRRELEKFLKLIGAELVEVPVERGLKT
jgi:hypothetical protein